MAVFLDTGFLLAMKNEEDKHHANAQALMRILLTNKHGAIYTSTFVFDEMVTLALVRLRNRAFAIDIGTYLLTSPRITVLPVLPQDFQESWVLFKKYADQGLSFTDCSILAQCHRLECEYVATYDGHFKGLIGTYLTLE